MQIDVRDYPSNSLEDQQSKKPDLINLPPSRRVVKGGVLRKKKTITSGISSLFVGADISKIVQMAIEDILVPAAKNLLSETISSSLDMFLYGEEGGGRRQNRTRNKGTGTTISYGKFYQNIANGENNRRAIRVGRRFEEIILEDRGEANDVLEAMTDLLEQYEAVTVADLYELIGMDIKHTDNRYGWTNLSKAAVRRVGNGWLLDVPEPKELPV